MASWQRHARLIIAVLATVFAVVVAFAFRSRQPETGASGVNPSDPNAVVETLRGKELRFNRDREEVLLEFQRLLTYADGAARMMGVKVTTKRGGDRTFVLRAEQGESKENETQLALSGNVQLEASDGLHVRTDSATYFEQEGIVRASGPVQFGRGRMEGTGVGLTYNKNSDLISILEKVSVHIAADDKGGSAADITSGFAELNRPLKTIRFENGMRTVRGGQTIDSDTGTAFLTADEKRLERLELRGNSRITGSGDKPGSLRSLTGRDMNLDYAEGGETIEHAVIMGDGVIQLAGEKDRPGRQVSAQALDITLAPDTGTATALIARDRVQLTMPGEPGTATRTVTSQALAASGDAEQGLTRATFSGDVRYREAGTSTERTARAQTLEAALAPGLGELQDATFRRGVRFEEGGDTGKMTATAAAARYVLNPGTLELTGSEPGAAAPRVVTDRIVVDATRIDIGLDGPQVKAVGAVRSTLQPASAEGRKPADGGGAKLPSMLKEEQPVHVTANDLAYDGAASRATYSGAARLTQAETSIKADTIVIDEKSGDLSAGGSVATAAVFLQKAKDQKEGAPSERVNTVATAKDFKYEEAPRRATYTGDAHVAGPQGDMTAAKIELYLQPSGDELDRVEAYDGVTLRENNRVTTGARMTYFGADQRYVVNGTPLKVVDECGRETIGRALTFFRATDRIVIDGSEQRTQTKGGSNCK